MRRLIPFALSLLFATIAHAGKIDADYHESFAVEPGARLELIHGDGDVTIVPWGEDRIQIDVEFHLDYSRFGLGKDPKFDVSFEQSGDTIRVEEHWSGAVVIGGFSMRERIYTYEIKAPEWVALELRGEDGDVSIEDWAAPIRVRSDDGDVRLERIDADVRAALEDGDLSIRGYSGKLDFASDDGDLLLDGCDGIELIGKLEDGDVEAESCDGRFDLRTDDGDIELAGRIDGARLATSDGGVALELAPGSRGEIDVESDEGGISIRIADGVGVEFDLTARDGSIRFDHPEITIGDTREGRAAGSVGGGGLRLRARSGEGSIRLGR